MTAPERAKWLGWGLTAILLFPFPPAPAAAPSLGEKIREIFVTPTPTPSPRRPKRKPKSPASGVATKEKKAGSPTPSARSFETPAPTPTPPAKEGASPSATPETRVATVSPDRIEDYDKNPEAVRQLLDDALALTKRNLGYHYGSADPASGGMDCSGFIYYVLRKSGLEEVPREASAQYVWVRKAGNFRAVLSHAPDSFELDELKPGDLLFWTGTYGVERDPPVTHTMIYLGKEKATGQAIMVGASDGRTYEGERQCGVSVFDFKTAPARNAAVSAPRPRFVGYGKIPGLGDEQP